MQLGADIFWRTVKAAMFMATVVVLLAFAPNAMAHGLHHAGLSGAISSAADSPRAAVAHDTATTTDVQSASWNLADPDESCPTGSGGRVDHVGCCGGILSCGTGCGAAIAPEDPPQPSAPKPVLASTTTLISVGVATVPADRPPRVFI